MNDEQLDARIRDAFAQLSLPPERVRQMVGRPPRARLPGAWIGLAAAAVVAVVAGPVLVRDAGPAPEGSATEPTPPVQVVRRAAAPQVAPVTVKGLWIGSTDEGSAITIVVLDQEPGGEVQGTVELEDGGAFTSLSVTGTVTGSDLVLAAPGLRLALAVNGTRMSGRAERAGHPDRQVSLVGSGPSAQRFPPTDPAELSIPKSPLPEAGSAERARAVLVPAQDPDALVDRGWDTLDRDVPASLALFERVLATDPRNVDALYGRGYALLQLGPEHADEASTSLCRAIELGGPDARREIDGLMRSRGLTCASSPEERTAPTLQLRSNRRALVYVDDRAIGYTPQDLPVSVGSHRIAAKIPGRPDSLQVREVDVSASVLVEFVF